MKSCPQCRQEWADSFQYCPNDAAPLQSHPADPLVGKCLANKYEVVEAFSHDRYGTVYRARHRYADQTCAIRLLPPQLTTEAEQVQRLKAVVRTGLDWTSPHIVRLHDMDSLEGGGYFLVEEWVDGKPLQTLLNEQGRLPGPVCVSLATQVCAALVEAHSRDLPHGQLTAGSVIVGSGAPAAAKTGGFGLAWVAGSELADDLTMLGALLFRMLTGEAALLAGGEEERPQLRQASELDSALRHSDVPNDLAEVVRGLLGIGPGPRFSSASKALARLQEVSAPKLAAPETQTAPARPTVAGQLLPLAGDASQEDELFALLEKPRAPWRRWTMLAVLLVLLGAGLFWLLGARPAPPPAGSARPQVNARNAVPTVDYEVVQRQGEGEPGHHAHLVVRVAGVPLYVIREHGSYPSTNARAEAVTAALQEATRRLLQDPAPRFRIRDDNGVPAIVQEEADGSRRLAIITITPADVQAYNARGRRKINAGELEEWWLARTVDYLGLFSLGQKPTLTTKTEDGAVLGQLYESTRASHPDAARLDAGEVSRGLDRLEPRAREVMQNSVFQFPGASPR